MPSVAQRRREKKLAAQGRRANGVAKNVRKAFEGISVPTKDPFLVEDTLKLVDFGLPDKIASRLYDAGLRTVDDIVRKTEDGLLAIRGFGQVSLSKLKAVLGKQGLVLRSAS